MDALLSIIVPVFNTEQYLPRCLDSILSQSFTDFELLLIDDGSTDGSGWICDAYAEKDSRIRAFHKENGGVSSARNLGLKEAKGEWVCFMDSDDELMPNALQVMADRAYNEVDLVMAGYEVYNDVGEKTYSLEKCISNLMPNESAVKEMYAPTDYRYQGYIWNKLFRLSLISSNSIRFAEDIFFNEDRLFVTPFVCVSGRNVSYTTIPVYRYFERPESAMMSVRKFFNPKFVTDLEAQIKMREVVGSRFENEEWHEIVDFSVYESYRRIVRMMKEFKYDNRNQQFQLRFKLIKAIGIGLFLRYEFVRNKRRFLKKLYFNGDR
jgi:glycosyltransferase EpsH